MYGPNGSRRGRATPSERWVSYRSDVFFHYPAAHLAELRARRGAPTFLYLFAYAPAPFANRLGACHGLELPFVFGTLRNTSLFATLGALPGSRILSRQMQRAWTTFARDGAPGCDMLPNWPAYRPPERACMVFDGDCSVESSRFDDVRRFWDEVRAVAA